MDANANKGYLFAILSAVIYGCMPLMAKHIYEDGVNPMTLVFLRNTCALLPLALLAYQQNRTLKIPAGKLPRIGLIASLGCCITPILLFSSYQFIDSGTATVFHFIYPAIVVVSEILFARKKTQPGNLISVLICICGICLFYSPQQTPDLTGSVLALSSGFTFAAYVVLLSHFDNRAASGFLFSFYIAAASSIAAFLICLFTQGFAFPSTLRGWELCILFSLLVTVGAVVLFQQSAFLIGSERTSILSTLEPITSIIIGVAVFGESLGIRTLMGSALVVTASLLIAYYDLKNAAQKKA